MLASDGLDVSPGEGLSRDVPMRWIGTGAVRRLLVRTRRDGLPARPCR